MLGGMLACGITHAGITPLDVTKCNMQVRKLSLLPNLSSDACLPGRPGKIQRSRFRIKNPHSRGRRNWYLERLWPDIRRLLPPGPVQIWIVRSLQGCLLEPRGRGERNKIQGIDMAGWVGVRRSICRRGVVPVGDDQGADSDEPDGDVPYWVWRRVRCNAGEQG